MVALVDGPPGEVTTAVSTTSGIPMLTLTGAGDALVDAARVLSTDVLGLSGSDPENLSQEVKPRSTAKTRTLEDLGIDSLALTGYGSVTQQFELSQDSFGVPVSSMDLHLEGSHTAFAEASGARLDVRVNGDLVDSAVLGEEATFDLDAHVPSSKLRSVNDVELTLNAVAPDGSACTPPSIPPAEVDLDSGASTVDGRRTGPARRRASSSSRRSSRAPSRSRCAAPRAGRPAPRSTRRPSSPGSSGPAGSPLEIQLMEPDAFLADDRSGLIVGALAADSEALDAPLKLSSTRLLDREDATVELTSQDPYAALESIDRNDRLVLMLGSWAPDNKAAPGELARKVVDAVVNAGWENLDGDLVIADEAQPGLRRRQPVAGAAPGGGGGEVLRQVVRGRDRVLLLLLALQFVDRHPARPAARARARRRVRGRRAGVRRGRRRADYEVDALGDVDDLEVHDYADEPRRRSRTSDDRVDDGRRRRRRADDELATTSPTRTRRGRRPEDDELDEDDEPDGPDETPTSDDEDDEPEDEDRRERAEEPEEPRTPRTSRGRDRGRAETSPTTSRDRADEDSDEAEPTTSSDEPTSRRRGRRPRTSRDEPDDEDDRARAGTSRPADARARDRDRGRGARGRRARAPEAPPSDRTEEPEPDATEPTPAEPAPRPAQPPTSHAAEAAGQAPDRRR